MRERSCSTAVARTTYTCAARRRRACARTPPRGRRSAVRRQREESPSVLYLQSSGRRHERCGGSGTSLCRPRDRAAVSAVAVGASMAARMLAVPERTQLGDGLMGRGGDEINKGDTSVREDEWRGVCFIQQAWHGEGRTRDAHLAHAFRFRAATGSGAALQPLGLRGRHGARRFAATRWSWSWRSPLRGDETIAVVALGRKKQTQFSLNLELQKKSFGLGELEHTKTRGVWDDGA